MYNTNKKWDEDELWKILRNCSKWLALILVEEMGGPSSKRTKTSSSGAYVSSSNSDAHVGVGLNTEDEPEPTIDLATRRPLGRDWVDFDLTELISKLERITSTMDLL